MKDLINETIDKTNKIKNKLLVKWIIAISIFSISVAYLIGNFNSSFFNRLDKIEQGLQNNMNLIQKFERENKQSHQEMMLEIKNINEINNKRFYDFEIFNNKQLELIIDYNKSNKDLLKKMLELNQLNFNMNQKNMEPIMKIDSIKINDKVSPPTIGTNGY